MSRALVSFYPLAGRVSMDSDGRPQVDCAGQGVPFVVAQSDLTVDDFDNFKPSPELQRLFVPHVQDSPSVVAAFQLTFLSCGGVALGAAVHHGVMDSISTFHFFRTWSTFCSRDGAAAAVLKLPCHDRTLLRGRSTPFVHPDALSVFCPKLAPLKPWETVVNEIFAISVDQVAALKRACVGGGSGDDDDDDVSTFCALSAHLWQCMCAARRLPPDATTRLIFPANVRRSLSPPLLDSYFGNAFIMLGATGKVRDIIASEDGLAAVAGRIRGTLRRMDDELVRSAIDYLELEHDMAVPRPPPRGSLPETELRVISWRGMGVYDADFGWGKPLVLHRAVQQRAGFIYLMDAIDGSVWIHVALELACGSQRLQAPAISHHSQAVAGFVTTIL
ncbi:unnamed protein product [Alopecurus aequalis]